MRSSIPGSGWRVLLLQRFGAKIGQGTVWKPGVRVKFPWKLEVGNYCWFGEDCWIDNLADVRVADHVCISQGAYLCTGNHDWSRQAFGLIAKSIALESGVWLGAQSIVAPGTYVSEGAVLTAGSVGVGRLERYTIYRGNKATPIGKRRMIS